LTEGPRTFLGEKDSRRYTLMTRLTRPLITSLISVSALLFVAWPTAALASTPPPGLGAAAGFAVLADSTGLTCTDSTVVGPVGIKSGTPVTTTRCVIPPVQVADGAYADFLTYYNSIAAQLGCTPDHILTGTLDGAHLAAGTYCFDAAATLTGTLTLIGSGPWLFEIGTNPTGGALTATNFTVVGGSPCNVTWWVRDAVTLTTSAFQGTLLAGVDITTTGTSLAGRLLATGAVTMKGSSNTFGCTAAGTVGLPSVPGGGSFVIGDLNSSIGTSVEFWGAQWAKKNSLSGGPAPASFKGFAEFPKTPACGTNWSADPGHSTPPPVGPLPSEMAVIVTSLASQSGNSISGNTPHIVIVKTDPGYAPNPGHAGTGTVVLMVC
jgi:Ice-binding-like